MSRFADPSRTETIDLGACQCPGTPHQRDEAVLRYQLGAAALARIGYAEVVKGQRGDPLLAWRQLVAETLVSWNLLADGPSGPIPAPVTPAAIAELDDATITVIAEAADRLIEERGRLPNTSGAPSPASSQGSASPTLTPTPTPGT